MRGLGEPVEEEEYFHRFNLAFVDQVFLPCRDRVIFDTKIGMP